MARSEDGEFELILGNKQLLSVFFIVVVLLGVFFTMGYIVGKNSVSPDMAAGRPPSGSLVVEPSDPAPKASGSALVVEPNKPSALSPPPTKSEPPAKKDKEKPVAEKKAEPTPHPPAPAISPRGEPAPGQVFFQVVASTRPDCEIIVDVLKRKGFSAMMAPGPNPDLFRVIVGPLSDAANISKIRTELEAAGFQKPYLRKY